MHRLPGCLAPSRQGSYRPSDLVTRVNTAPRSLETRLPGFMASQGGLIPWHLDARSFRRHGNQDAKSSIPADGRGALPPWNHPKPSASGWNAKPRRMETWLGSRRRKPRRDVRVGPLKPSRLEIQMTRSLDLRTPRRSPYQWIKAAWRLRRLATLNPSVAWRFPRIGSPCNMKHCSLMRIETKVV
jgi:hypothetical protein